MAYRGLQLQFPLPPLYEPFPFLPYMSQCTFRWNTPPLSKHTYFMDDPHKSEKFRQAHELQNMKSLYYQRQCNHKYPYKNNSRFVLSTFKVISRQILKLIWRNFLFFLKVQKQVR